MAVVMSLVRGPLTTRAGGHSLVSGGRTGCVPAEQGLGPGLAAGLVCRFAAVQERLVYLTLSPNSFKSHRSEA